MRIETARLCIQPLSLSDDSFVLRLLNDPDWLRYIGDRGVNNLDYARKYIRNGPKAMQSQYGFSLAKVSLRGQQAGIGMCGLLQRDFLQCADIGYAFLPEFRGKGYALEAAEATSDYARDVLGMAELAAIVSRDNEASRKLLGKLGMVRQGLIQPYPEEAPLCLYSMHF